MEVTGQRRSAGVIECQPCSRPSGACRRAQARLGGARVKYGRITLRARATSTPGDPNERQGRHEATGEEPVGNPSGN